MKQDELRRKLIDGTIQVIAQHGLDKATTKQISLVTNINEVYIYRCFKDKEDMFARAFDVLDNELADRITQNAPVIYMQDLDYETRCRMMFTALWQFLISNRDRCLAYVQYYYSPYFSRHSAIEHKERFAPLVNEFKVAFRDEADVWMILNHILNVMLAFSVMVHTNQMSKDDDYAEHVFRVVYVAVKQYFRMNEEGDL